MSRRLSIILVVGLAVVVELAAMVALWRGRRLPAAAHIAPEGGVRADTTVRFAWHAVRGAVRYRIDVARPDSVPVASAATLGDTTIDVSTLALARGVDYRWTVTAIDANGRVSRSAPITFRVTP
ncbi:MAG TPA: hypothetical protein VFA43_20910 [Gemmatimonadaceae bacterium]|nr:hypothetical protein [Gemmatimonadaceae bacterium]